MAHLRHKLPQGFGLIETVVGAAIIGVVLFSAAQIGQFVFRLVDESNFRLRAAFLAEEGIEVMRILRDTSWATNVAPLALSTDYYMTWSGGAWQVGTTPSPFVDGTFDRRLRVEAVSRDSTDAITTSGGTLDPNTKKVTIAVGWSNRGRWATTTLATYLTNLFSN